MNTRAILLAGGLMIAGTFYAHAQDVAPAVPAVPADEGVVVTQALEAVVVETPDEGIAYPLPLAPRPVLDGSPDFKLWRTVGALLLVLGGLYVALRLMKRAGYGVGGANAKRRLVVQERLAIDHKRQLLLVSVDGHELLIAVSPENITRLAGFDKSGPRFDEMVQASLGKE